ncbi:MAG: hypothetical protein C4346_15660 [Chloroflexota bacterium]
MREGEAPESTVSVPALSRQLTTWQNQGVAAMCPVLSPVARSRTDIGHEPALLWRCDVVTGCMAHRCWSSLS